MLNNLMNDRPLSQRTARPRPTPVVSHGERPTGFSLPQGSRSGPNCGVTAVAIICGLTFDDAWNRLRGKRNANWKGKTTVRDWIAVLEQLGVKHDLRTVTGMTLQTFVQTKARKGVRYMARTSGHVQVVQDGWVIDQMGAKHISQFWGRRKRLTHIIEIME